MICRFAIRSYRYGYTGKSFSCGILHGNGKRSVLCRFFKCIRSGLHISLHRAVYQCFHGEISAGSDFAFSGNHCFCRSIRNGQSEGCSHAGTLTATGGISISCQVCRSTCLRRHLLVYLRAYFSAFSSCQICGVISIAGRCQICGIKQIDGYRTGHTYIRCACTGNADDADLVGIPVISHACMDLKASACMPACNDGPVEQISCQDCHADTHTVFA